MLQTVVLYLILFNFQGTTEVQTVPQPYWNETDNLTYQNQSSWKTAAPDCGKPFQAPINIPVGGVWSERSNPTIKFPYYDISIQQIYVTLQNGNEEIQTVRLWAEGGLLPYVTGGALYGSPFTFEQAIFHWGSEGNKGSEHQIYGTQYTMEVQLVHHTDYAATVKDALGKDNKSPVLVVCIMFQERPSYVNQNLEPLIKAVSQLRNSGERLLVPGFKLSNMLPARPSYYFRYEDSRMNLPNCEDQVEWLIMNTPIPIGTQQMNAFRQLRDTDGRPIGDNYRGIQDTDGRRIYMGLAT